MTQYRRTSPPRVAEAQAIGDFPTNKWTQPFSSVPVTEVLVVPEVGTPGFWNLLAEGIVVEALSGLNWLTLLPAVMDALLYFHTHAIGGDTFALILAGLGGVQAFVRGVRPAAESTPARAQARAAAKCVARTAARTADRKAAVWDDLRLRGQARQEANRG